MSTRAFRATAKIFCPVFAEGTAFPLMVTTRCFGLPSFPAEGFVSEMNPNRFNCVVVGSILDKEWWCLTGAHCGRGATDWKADAMVVVARTTRKTKDIILEIAMMYCRKRIVGKANSEK